MRVGLARPTAKSKATEAEPKLEATKAAKSAAAGRVRARVAGPLAHSCPSIVGRFLAP